MNRQEQIKMWEEAAANMYGKEGAKAVGGFESNASKQGRTVSAQERAAAVKHAQNKAAADARIRAAQAAKARENK